MLPPVYTKAVREDYRRKREKNDVPFDMKKLSTGGLKAACLEVRRRRHSKNDEPLLIGFFGEAADQKACLIAIGRLANDKFKPVVYFLKGKTTNPDDKVVELVAWLIDFNGRPYNPGIDYFKYQENPQGPLIETTIEVPPTEAGHREDPSTSSFMEDGEKKKKRRKIILVITITMALSMVGYWIWIRPNNPPAPTIMGRQGCMYWNEDHYDTISCRQHGDTLVIALDSNRLLHFRKITRPDTITENAIGYVWYVKYRKTYEFYTADGYHPIDQQLRLHPLTAYIIRNHIHPQQ